VSACAPASATNQRISGFPRSSCSSEACQPILLADSPVAGYCQGARAGARGCPTNCFIGPCTPLSNTRIAPLRLIKVG